MATNPYTSVTISGYNSSPPPDDGTTGADNTVEWDKHKTKLGDPIKTGVESVNTNVLAAFGKTINTDSAEDNAHAGGLSFTGSIFTIATGAITPTRVNVVLAAESGTSDTLDTMATGSMSDGGFVILSVDTGDTITINHAEGSAGQIHLADSFDFVMSGDDRLLVQRDGADWYELARASATPRARFMGTEQASTSGTTIDFTGIPAGVRSIDIMFEGVSVDGTQDMLIQIGDSGGFETTGYVSTTMLIANGGSATSTSSTAGFVFSSNAATDVLSGIMSLRLKDPDNFTWVSGHNASVNTTTVTSGGGHKSLSAELTQVRITSVSTPDDFDAGSINIQYGF